MVKNLEESNKIYSNIFDRETEALIGFYSLDEHLIYENKYLSKTILGSVIEDFIKKKIKEIIKCLNISKFFYRKNLFFLIKKNNKLERIEDNISISSYILNLQDTLKLLGYYDSSSTAITNNMSLKIYVKYKKKYKHIANRINEYIINSTHLIAKPINNKLKYYLYNKYSKEFKIIKYSKEDINKLEYNFPSFYSYCNAKNFLYIYESIYNNNLTNSNRFINIHLQNNKINIISSNFPNRILQSMIYIPECYIFIIGGKNEKDVLIYKIKEGNKNYKKYPHLLPDELLEPSLIYLNNKYLYAFENSTLNLKIMRMNLILISPFEIIKLRINKEPMNQKFFGVVQNKNSILFLGGQMLNTSKGLPKNCFEFHFESNKLVISKREFKPFDFIEKTFIPIEDGIYMQLTEIKKGNKYQPKIIFFDGRSQEVENSEKDTMDKFHFNK